MPNEKISLIKNIPGARQAANGVRKSRKFFRRFFSPVWLYLLSRKLGPLSSQFGFDRGTPLDRYYIENFLEMHKEDVKDVCLELLDNTYTARFGDTRVKVSDVLDIDTNNKAANIHGDLRDLTAVKDNTYDCIIFTQVLQFVDDFQSAAREVYRILKPGGVLLATLPAMSRIDVRAGVQADFWRFTHASTTYIFAPLFGDDKVQVTSHGNTYAGLAFWTGQALEDVSRRKLDIGDPDFPVIITLRAKK